MSTSDPIVTIVMANYNGARHIGAAVRSVLKQTLREIELIISDDCSTDASIATARAAAAGDPRVFLIEGRKNEGPAATRNRALRHARGRWIAIVDSDDYIHPERLERLVKAAEADDAHIVADDMLTFYDDGAKAPHGHLKGAMTKRPTWVTPAQYAATNHLFGSRPSLGYLKPLFRRSDAGGARIGYDESLKIAEDFDLVMRMLIGGARMRVYPDLGYFYRKHDASISHRLKESDIDAMLAAHDRLGEGLALGSLLQGQLDGRRQSLINALAFTHLIEALKARDLKRAVAIGLRTPGALALLRYPLLDRLKAKLARPKPVAPANDLGQPRIALLSRQRVVGATNGSSSYLLSIVGALRDAGYAIDYIGASPKIFGRWPFLKLMPELGVFERYVVAGGLRVKNAILALDPRIALTAALGVADKLITKLRLPSPSWSKPAPYAIMAKPTRDDMLFVARSVAPGTRAILCDYAFLAPLAPYALRPDAPVMTVMHDLMSSRVADDPMEKVPEEVARLTGPEEFRMIAMADVILAIQSAEAAKVKAALPKIETILVPHFVPSVKAPQPGKDDTLLFVGSNTQPNVVGIKWFFEACWPLIRAARSNARLDVAGSVARSVDSAPEGVRMLGVVPELAPYYTDAGVVISPLRTGSGLKIKLIEALAAGKSLVGTSVTAQGVERIVANAMIIEDDGEALATHIIALLGDADRRFKMGASALQCIDNHFSNTACFGELIARLGVSTRIPAAQFAHG